MDDIMGKFREVLSDEESMKQLSELAQMFSSSDTGSSENTSGQEQMPQNSSETADSNPFGDFDFTKIFQIQQLLSTVSDDKNAGLLLALKPLLKEEKQKKVDKAVKMLKLFAVWTVLKDSGLLKDFL
ncbi:MAG: hypothetical protein ACI4I9_09055 [Porcipelethomonas sp.]